MPVNVYLCLFCRDSPLRYRTDYVKEWKVVTPAILQHIHENPKAIAHGVCDAHYASQLAAIEFYTRSGQFLSNP